MFDLGGGGYLQNEGLGNRPGPHYIKLTISGKLEFNGNYHQILDADWL